jgi:hypothetical protein
VDFRLLLFAGFDRRTKSQELCYKANTLAYPECSCSPGTVDHRR